MNKEAMYKVADTIEKHSAVALNMYDWIAQRPVYPDEHHCGTAACIAGFTLLALDPKRFMEAQSNVNMLGQTVEDVMTPAGALLGLDPFEAGDLFVPEINFMRINEHRDEVPAILRWMADNDKVDWHRAIEETGSSIA